MGHERKRIQLTDQMTTKDRIVLCLSELSGTAILVFLGCMGCVTAMSGGSIPHLTVCLTFGLAVMVSVQIFGHISGSHINPVVTVAAVTLGNIPVIQVPIYFAVTPDELMGNKWVTHPDGVYNKTIGVCSPAVSTSISATQGLLVEFIISFILGLVCCGVWDSKNSDKHDSVAIRFGFAIAVLAIAAVPEKEL
ncbi:hypothetical protein NQ317_008784 [Molorchus minor]|uniref:Uncharacterized protein n=1 Tax=Molorchus minor TaxID=1323400 RepID=A0ABQ9IUG6_9CUCU|nr:hypothetical protein NQ317_008784 [Molorchus minor]